MKVKAEVTIKLQLERRELVTITEALEIAGGANATALLHRLNDVITRPLDFVTNDGKWVDVDS